MTFDIDTLTPRAANRRIEGVSFPAFIKNGATYFLTDLCVYEDGIVECWGGVDLALFRQKVAEGWVQIAAPEGAMISALHLAHMTVADAQWEMTPDSLIERVEAIVTHLNPSRVNLFDMQGDETDRSGPIGIRKVTRSSSDTWRPGKSPAFRPRPIPGHSAEAFWRQDDAVHVVNVSLFEDDVVRIDGLGAPTLTTLDDLHSDDHLDPARAGDRVHLYGLGSFIATSVEFTVPRDDFIAQLEIDRDKALGRETPLSRTLAAFRAYEADPTTEHLETLRAAYESVPAHMQPYCGDMDSRDIPIRIALYGEQEIEHWSHYAVAKARGEPLPSIRVPKPKDGS